MHLLFTNTGVQILCIPLSSTRRYTAAQIGSGWQYCQTKVSVGNERGEPIPSVRDVPFVQWQIIQGRTCRLFLAVDTSLGDPAAGHVAAPDALAGDLHVAIEGFVDLTGEVLPSVSAIDLCFRAATATTGDAKTVDLVVDFGNSRSGALLLEASSVAGAPVKMMPFELLDRYRLEAWDDQGEPCANPAAQWFSSKTRWCNAPYRTPQAIERTEYVSSTVRQFWRQKKSLRERRKCIQPDLFADISLARIGRESEDLGQHIGLSGELRLGVSSPKRYLWADDESWLDGAFWHMADPFDRAQSGAFTAKLAGEMLTYFDLPDQLPEASEALPPLDPAAVAPTRPRYAPRMLMTAALYELLCQAYCFANSARYRTRAGDANRIREIRSLSLSFPSGMCQAERDRWRRQAELAIRIFQHTLGKHQAQTVSLHFGIDEASAVHLAYLWSELQLLGQAPDLWFSLMGRRAAAGAAGKREVRIACIDVGGGTSNLMIANYEFQAGVEDVVQGRVLHRDSVTIAGDELIKRLLETIIVPALAGAVGLEAADALLLFGPEVPRNRGFRSQRVEWMSRLLLPLSEAYLKRSEESDSTPPISHTDPAIVDPAVLESLGAVCNQLRGVGYYNLWQDLLLVFDAERFRRVVNDVFDELLQDYCERIAALRVDLVLLAGQPTKLAAVQEIVRRNLPLPDSRIIPMHQYYAGNWYPYQSIDGRAPGKIVDPKSAVVVGAAIHFLAHHGWLPQFRYRMTDSTSATSYCWGAMTDGSATLRPERILFQPASTELGGTGPGRGDVIEIRMTSKRMLIGRTPSDNRRAQATPIYDLKLDAKERVGPIDVAVRLRRVRATRDVEETLVVDSVTGHLAGETPVLGHNVQFQWRTLADEQFFLDTGGLDYLELENSSC